MPAEPAHPVTIRPAGAADLEDAVAVWVASNDARAGCPSTTPAIQAMVRGWMTGPDATLLVAVDPGGTVVGMALAVDARTDNGQGEPMPGVAHVSQVFVAPDHWGQRIGARLLDTLLAGIARRDYDRVQIWTQAGNERALRLYRSRGFSETEDRLVNHLGETTLRMERPV